MGGHLLGSLLVSPKEIATGPDRSLCTPQAHPSKVSAHSGPGGARRSAGPATGFWGSKFKAHLENSPLRDSLLCLPTPFLPLLTSVKHMLNSLELLAFSPCSCGREGTS